MHLQTAPHSILYNSPFVCFSAAHARAERRPDSTNRHFPCSEDAGLAANPVLMAKKQICANSTRYITSYFSFRKPELSALERLRLNPGSDAHLHIPSTKTHAFPERRKILRVPRTCQCALPREAAQQNWVVPS